MMRQAASEPWWPQLLIDLVPYLRLHTDLLSEAFDLARAMRDDAERARIVATLAPDLPEALLSTAVDLAAGVEGAPPPGMMLSALAPRLCKLPPERLYPLWRGLLHVLAVRPRPGLLADLGALAPVLLGLGGTTAAGDIVDASMRWYRGGPDAAARCTRRAAGYKSPGGWATAEWHMARNCALSRVTTAARPTIPRPPSQNLPGVDPLWICSRREATNCPDLTPDDVPRDLPETAPPNDRRTAPARRSAPPLRAQDLARQRVHVQAPALAEGDGLHQAWGRLGAVECVRRIRLQDRIFRSQPGVARVPPRRVGGPRPRRGGGEGRGGRAGVGGVEPGVADDRAGAVRHHDPQIGGQPGPARAVPPLP